MLAFIVSCRSLAERSFAFVLPDARVFLSCLVFSLFTGSGLGGRHWAPSSFRPVFPVPCVSYCVLAFRPVSSVGFGWLVAPCPPVLALAIAWGCVIPSVRSLASPRRPCVSSSLCFARLVPRFAVPRRSPSRSSVCLLRPSRSRAVSCRSCHRAVLLRSALLPALLVVGRGGLLCGPLSSRAARCLEFRFSVLLVLWG